VRVEGPGVGLDCDDFDTLATLGASGDEELHARLSAYADAIERIAASIRPPLSESEHRLTQPNTSPFVNR
jgi:hypothetical protein